MEVETAVVETPAIETPAPAPAPAPAPVYFGNDGVLAEGWQSTMPEGYRDEPSLKTVNDTKVLAKMFVDTKRMVGKDTVVVPNDMSPKDEWDSYHIGGGRPETIADYNLKVPDGFPEDITNQAFPEGRIAKWQERFFAGGVSKKAADKFVQEFSQDILADYQSVIAAQESAMEELKKGLAADWGAAYEQKKHLGDVALTEAANGDMELQQRISAKFGNDPDFIRAMGNLGGKFAEGKAPGYAAIPTPNDLQDQINELMKSPVLVNPLSTPLQRKEITDKIMVLREKMNT